MQTAQKPERDVADDQSGLIKKWVLDMLGEPVDLHEVQVRRLWPDRYRVNILVGVDAASVRIAHSFFLEANRDGDIVGSTPGITKQY
jgi:hypothetical protein